ncbi:MAG: (d)CMP kinase [Phycisphaerales bacterium]
MIITIDGPAGTGKSTVAHALAQRLGLEFLDTGAMYRAAALLSIDADIDPGAGATLADALRERSMHFDWKSDPPALLLGDRDVTSRIRDRDVNERVSLVAREAEVRSVLVEWQRRIGSDHPRLVTEGRDQGSVAFPDASIKFYLDARPDVRAQRRGDQLEQAGRTVDRSEILREIIRRDAIDSTRADSPLTQPPDAIAIDTSDMTLEQVVDRLESEVRAALAPFASGRKAPDRAAGARR